MSVLDLWVPILASSAAIFFASFLSWMVLPFHRKDWVKLEREDELMKAIDDLEIPRGSYQFPGFSSPEEMKGEEYAKKWEAGPRGILTVFPKVEMGPKLGMTFGFFVVVNFCLAYLATIVIGNDAEFMLVFRFIATAGFITFFASICQHAIWFHNRIVGHLLESILYGLVAGAIFGALWPSAG